MKKNIICNIICIVLSLAFLTGGILALKARDDLNNKNNAELEKLRQEQVDVSKIDNSQQIAEVQKENEALQNEIETLNFECENLDSSNAELEQLYETLSQDEENIYYMTILESLKKGMKQVESYLNYAQ